MRTLGNFCVGLVLFCTLPACTTTAAAPDATGYAANPATLAFIDEMVAQHGFDREQLVVVFSKAEHREDILEQKAA